MENETTLSRENLVKLMDLIVIYAFWGCFVEQWQTQVGNNRVWSDMTTVSMSEELILAKLIEYYDF